MIVWVGLKLNYSVNIWRDIAGACVLPEWTMILPICNSYSLPLIPLIYQLPLITGRVTNIASLLRTDTSLVLLLHNAAHH